MRCKFELHKLYIIYKFRRVALIVLNRIVLKHCKVLHKFPCAFLHAAIIHSLTQIFAKSIAYGAWYKHAKNLYILLCMNSQISPKRILSSVNLLLIFNGEVNNPHFFRFSLIVLVNVKSNINRRVAALFYN